MAGFVYVMSNLSFPDLLKIGKTAKDPTTFRVDELNTTGVPHPFKCEYYVFVDEFDRLERQVHAELGSFRANQNREFFELNLNQAVAVIRGIAAQMGDIKFEKDFNTDGSPIPTYTGKVIDVEKILKSHPKAAKVLEYNKLAQDNFDKLISVPGDLVSDFLSVLENEPSISDEGLEKLFETPSYKQHFQPFNDLVAGYFYNLCLQENINMALEFKSDFELLHPRFRAKTIFQKLSEKYGIQTEKYDLDSSSYFTTISNTISDIDNIKLIDLENLFSEINLELTFMTNYFTISQDGEMLFSHIPRADLLPSMKESWFSPNSLVPSHPGPAMEKARQAGDTYAAEKIIKEVGYELQRPFAGLDKYIIRRPDGVETKLKTAQDLFYFFEMEAKRFEKRPLKSPNHQA